jgi:hypothetical protein
LQQDIETARTDAAIESIAREQLGLIRPGDHPVVLVSQPSADQPAPSPSRSAPPAEPVWRQWLDYFFG